MIGFAVFLGYSDPSAQPVQPGTGAGPSVPGTNDPSPPILAGPVGVPGLESLTNAPVSPAPAIERQVEPAGPPPDVPVSPAAAEVIKLAQAGVGEQVIASYVENSPAAFSLSSDAIVYLNDLGVSSAVITSMIQHDTRLTTPAAPPAEAPVAPVAEQAPPVPNEPGAMPPPDQAPPPAQPAAPDYQTQPVAAAPPVQDTQAAYFYDTLAPYGSWVDVAGYGWCWQPTVAVVNVGWRPYCDSGRWYWSDAGWYWSSDYSWGWAPFHYGRWFHHGRVGWIWCPDRVWGPSWVSWRYANGYCGWAPLPPAARWGVGIGFTYYGGRVGVGFEFGLSDFHYAWVSTGHFYDSHINRFCEPPERCRAIYGGSKVVNNYAIGRNNTVINNGLARDTITKSAGHDVRTISIRDHAGPATAGFKPDRVQKDGSSLVVYRPQLSKTPPAMPAALSGRPAGGQFNGPTAVKGSPGSRGVTSSTLPADGSSKNTRPSSPAKPGFQPTAPAHPATPPAPTGRASLPGNTGQNTSHPGAPVRPNTGTAPPSVTIRSFAPAPGTANAKPASPGAMPPKLEESTRSPKIERELPQTPSTVSRAPAAPKSYTPPPAPAPAYSRPEPRASAPPSSYSHSESVAHPPPVFHQTPAAEPRYSAPPSYHSEPAPSYSRPSSSPSYSPSHGDKSDRSR